MDAEILLIRITVFISNRLTTDTTANWRIKHTAIYLYATASCYPTSKFAPFPFGAYRAHFLKRKS